MSGKIIVGFVTAAVSSASAASVGVVYTKFVHNGNNAPVMEVADVAPVSSTAKVAVVLNTNEGYFTSFKDSASSEADGPVCPGGESSQRCVVVGHASDVHLKILGYTLSLPPIWLGGDSEDSDSSSNRLSTLFLNDWPADLRIVVHIGRRHGSLGARLHGQLGQDLGGPSDSDSDADPKANKSSETDVASETGDSENNWTGQGDSQMVTFEVLQTPSLMGMLPLSISPAAFSNPFDSPLASLLSSFQSHIHGDNEQTPPSQDSYVYSSAPVQNLAITVPDVASVPASPIPEASTWTMTIAGFAALGLFKRRRIAAALGFAKR